jgi:hypothetical protein
MLDQCADLPSCLVPVLLLCIMACQVLAQLSKLCEADVFEELDLLAATDLSNVEYMPAYLNKRLNNKLWSRRKAIGDVPCA